MPYSSQDNAQVGGLIFYGLHKNTYKSFRTHRDNHKLALFRTLLGTTQILHQSNPKKIDTRHFLETQENLTKNHRINFFHVPCNTANSNNTNRRIDSFCEVFLGQEYKAGILGQYFSQTKSQNRAFYMRLLSEIGYALYYRRSAPTCSFIYIYRAIEIMCYALPLLVYKAKHADFIGGFTELNKLFTSENDKSELPFFKRYLKLVKHQENEGYSFDVDVLSGDSANATNIKKLFAGIVEKERIQLLTPPAVPNSSTHDFSFSSVDFLSFIISLRNRFFHARTGDGPRNIDLSNNITNPDEIFSSVIDSSLNWIAVVFADILIEEIKFNS